MRIVKVIRRGAKNSRVQYEDGTIALVPTASLGTSSIKSTEELVSIYHNFNKKYFGSQLPAMPIRVNKRKSSLGMYCVRADGRQWIELSDRLFNLSEKDFIDTFVHEMIHAWQYNIDLSPLNHSARFKFMADKLNREFGLNICVRYDAVERSGQSEFYISKIDQNGRSRLICDINRPVETAACTVWAVPIEFFRRCRKYDRTLQIAQTYGTRI